MSPQAIHRIRLAIAGVLALTGFGCASSDAPSRPKPSLSTTPQIQAGAERSAAPGSSVTITKDPDSLRLQTDTVDAYARDLEAAIAKRNAAARPGTRPAEAIVPPPALALSFSAPFDPDLPQLDFLSKDIALFIAPPQEKSTAPRTWSALLTKGTAPVANEALSISSPSETAEPLAAPATRPSTDVASTPPSLRDQAPVPETIATSDALATRLSHQLRTDPRNPAVHLEHQLLQLLLGHPVPQLESIASLPADDREVLAALMDALANFRTTLRSSDNALIGRKTQPLIDLADRLRASAGLRLPNVQLCTDVRRFGVYEALDSRKFLAGRRHEVIVYADVENFESRQSTTGQWETSLAQELAIYNEAGQRVHEDKRQPVKDTSASRRRDFFIASKTSIPATLPPGHYYLKITVLDTLSQRQTQQTISFQISER